MHNSLTNYNWKNKNISSLQYCVFSWLSQWCSLFVLTTETLGTAVLGVKDTFVEKKLFNFFTMELMQSQAIAITVHHVKLYRLTIQIPHPHPTPCVFQN